MNIDFFREFIVLADTRNYWEASERLFIGQSTLTKHIKNMEKELGVALFARTSRKVELTDFGKLMIPYARAVMDTKYEYTERIAIEKEAINGKIILGVIPSMVQYGITSLLAGFSKECSGSLVKVLEDDSVNLKDCLRQNRCELAFIRESKGWPIDDDLVKLHYMDDRMVALLPAGHPLAGQKKIRLEQLQDEKFVLLKQQTMMYQLCMDACQRVGFKPQVAFDCHRLDAILDLVTQGMGVSLLMNRHVPRPAHGGPSEPPAFCAVDIIPEITSSLYLCYCKKAVLSDAVKSFIRYAESRKVEG